jgi:predicted  nucleic acid-binding Zn-ribbon protein
MLYDTDTVDDSEISLENDYKQEVNMKEISVTKKVEVAQHYLLGCTYGEIEQYTGVSHGSIANIVQELETGRLHVPGTPFDQVNDLRQLSLDLKKKGLSTSQAVLGLILFDKAHDLDIVPEQFEQWSQLISKFNAPDFPTGDFLEAALRLFELEKSEGKTFDMILEEYGKAKANLEKIKTKAATLGEKRATLSEQLASTSAQVQGLEKDKATLESKVEVLADRAEELQSRVDGSKLVRTALDKEIWELQQKKVKLSSQVDGKEESLAQLNDIGFQNEDLIRVRTVLEQISQDTDASQEDVKKRFFQLLSSFKGIIELETSRGAEMVALEDLTYEKSVLTGEIAALENKKSVLQGEIGQSGSSVMEEIRATSENTILSLRQQADDISAEIDHLFAEALRLAGIIGEMQAMAKKGNESQKSLIDFIQEVKERVGIN